MSWAPRYARKTFIVLPLEFANTDIHKENYSIDIVMLSIIVTIVVIFFKITQKKWQNVDNCIVDRNTRAGRGA